MHSNIISPTTAIFALCLAASYSEAFNRVYSEVQVSKSLFLYAESNDIIQDGGQYLRMKAGKNQVSAFFMRECGMQKCHWLWS